MTRRINIVGAGISGLLAANVLHGFDCTIFERQDTLPNNHHAVLRFRDNKVGLATGIDFRKVRVLKHVNGSVNPIADAARYSLKVTGEYKPRSILNTDAVERYIAPSDFIAQLAANANVMYQVDWNLFKEPSSVPVITTIPLNVVFQQYSKYNPEWEPPVALFHKKGWTFKTKLNGSVPIDFYATVYYPHSPMSVYRASITGNEYMVEGMGMIKESEARIMAERCLHDFGISTDSLPAYGVGGFYASQYQKLADVTPQERNDIKRFILHLSEEWNIYSLGRFATWRPGLLIDDLIQDIEIIKRMIKANNSYGNKLIAINQEKD